MKKITNNTCNGKCSGCGECCSNTIPLFLPEIKRIKKAIKDYNITYDYKDFITPEGIHMLCPFLDTKTKRCKLHQIDYNLKPEVCKKFSCGNSDKIINKNRKYFDTHADINGFSGIFKPLELIFFDNPMSLLLLASREFHCDTPEKLDLFLRKFGNSDVADAIKDGKIVLDWSDTGAN